MRARLLPLVLLLTLCAAGAQAGKVYKWKDSNGIVHYGDRPPAASTAARELTVIPFRAEPGALVRLRLTQEGGQYLAWVDNALAGPVEVRLDFGRSSNVRGEPQLPARATVPGSGNALVARIVGVDPARNGDFELRLDAVPGKPGATPRDVEYVFPLLTRDLRVDQGYGGSYSHNDAQNHYAVDFAAPIGTDVVAARDGVVMQVENDFDQAGLNREKLGGRANFVRIVHDDGTMALYAHLRENGVMVRMGQRVRAGQLIGRSGNTGFTSGPHLHFALQVNRGMQLVSIPFRMFSPHGILRFGESRAGAGHR
ncbi:M23 family metallopeptidase [Lysobacter sp. M15]|uniref:peptidoglycan DD-metalloendopeptidase family protein n=1 Tax=Lysobacter sp. M15 TaxID=2916837 RepID=UPI001F5761EF|nr:M23 family metallopeptidase [Lysobacter sp. M15]HEX5664211.1 M23 family metallopeptidase [Xanthomonadaceae bacterium]